VVVKSDPQVMQAADRILDIGPGPGERGGQIVFYGTPKDLANAKQSLTAQYLTSQRKVAAHRSAQRLQATGDRPQPRIDANASIRIVGVREHNLKSIDAELPLNRLTVVTGVSGSGKSTLVQNVLYPALLKHFGKPTEAPGEHERIEGADLIEGVVMVDQTPIGRTTRSNPASYVGAFDTIRKLFAAAPLAKERG